MKNNNKKKAIIYASVLFGILIVFAIGAKTLSSRVGEFIRNASSSPVVSFSSVGCRSLSVSYGISEVDDSFGVSRTVFEDAVKEAEGIWEKGSGDDLFIKSENPSVLINLVFDERQEETNRLKELLGSIEGDREKFEALKKEYDDLVSKIAPAESAYKAAKAEYEMLVEDLNSTIALYNARKKMYEDNVVYWNARGGAPKKDYDRLAKEYDDVRILYGQVAMREGLVNASFEKLKGVAEAYNTEAGKINTIAGILSRMAADLNENASDYNRIQGDRDEFVTGLYSSSALGKKIDVYQFYDYRELVIILAHEMGHSLGLEHALDPKSIMYPKVTDQPASLSDEDIRMLKDLCSKK